MCGRYSNVKDMNQLGIEFGAQLRTGIHKPAPNLDVRPTTPVPFLQARLGDDGTVRRELTVGRWGIIPTFAKTFESKFATFNARSETSPTNPHSKHPSHAGAQQSPSPPTTNGKNPDQKGPTRNNATK